MTKGRSTYYIFLIITFLLFPLRAIAEERPDIGDVILAVTSSVRVTVSDQAKDGCFTAISNSKNSVELEFLSRGFNVSDTGVTDVSFTVLGYEFAESGCAIIIQMKVDRPLLSYIPYYYGEGLETEERMDIGSYTIYTQAHLLTGNKEQMSKRITNTLVDEAKNLIVEILKKRQNIFSRFPRIKANFDKAQESR